MPDGGGRLLKQRSGHSLPPNNVKYSGEQGEDIISAGWYRDTMLNTTL